ncbi:MAG: energy-coupling factor transporter ATPase [Oscillospiraceae bacterium]|jgi:energy-coupling factor transport system ATP-binding protein|nr:energy-coupling factor transporter ATPase [Oscillospiraceae bacterium]
MSLLEVKNLTYIYGKGTPFEMRALDGVSLSVEKGEIVALIGHTGSGKSTLIQHLNALLKPHSGQVLFMGKDINADKALTRSVRFQVGLCFQYPEYQLFESTVYRDIAFGPTNMGLKEDEVRAAVSEAAAFVGLKEDYFEKSPFDLSGGEKRRVAVAGVMAMRPEVLILDEPTAGLDPNGRRVILSLIRNYCTQTGKTVIIVSHSMDDVASLASRIIVMNRGKIAMDGSVEQVFLRSAELTKMGLNIPQVTQILLELKKRGYAVNSSVFTLEGARRELLRVLKEGGGAK